MLFESPWHARHDLHRDEPRHRRTTPANTSIPAFAIVTVLDVTSVEGVTPPAYTLLSMLAPASMEFVGAKPRGVARSFEGQEAEAPLYPSAATLFQFGHVSIKHSPASTWLRWITPPRLAPFMVELFTVGLCGLALLRLSSPDPRSGRFAAVLRHAHDHMHITPRAPHAGQVARTRQCVCEADA